MQPNVPTQHGVVHKNLYGSGGAVQRAGAAVRGAPTIQANTLFNDVVVCRRRPVAGFGGEKSSVAGSGSASSVAKAPRSRSAPRRHSSAAAPPRRLVPTARRFRRAAPVRADRRHSCAGPPRARRSRSAGTTRGRPPSEFRSTVRAARAPACANACPALMSRTRADVPVIEALQRGQREQRRESNGRRGSARASGDQAKSARPAHLHDLVVADNLPREPGETAQQVESQRADSCAGPPVPRSSPARQKPSSAACARSSASWSARLRGKPATPRPASGRAGRGHTAARKASDWRALSRMARDLRCISPSHKRERNAVHKSLIKNKLFYASPRTTNSHLLGLLTGLRVTASGASAEPPGRGWFGGVPALASGVRRG